MENEKGDRTAMIKKNKKKLIAKLSGIKFRMYF